MTGKSVRCIKIDDIPERLLLVVTAKNFDSRSGRTSVIHSFERFIAIEILDADRWFSKTQCGSTSGLKIRVSVIPRIADCGLHQSQWRSPINYAGSFLSVFSRCDAIRSGSGMILAGALRTTIIISIEFPPHQSPAPNALLLSISEHRHPMLCYRSVNSGRAA